MAQPPERTELLHSDVARFPRARLTVVKGPDKGAEVVLEGQAVVIGSEESCQLKLSDTSVSRRHVELSGGPGGYRVRDLRSTNGVFIEGVQVLEGRLTEKARLTIGRTELRFEPERQQIQWPLSQSDHFGDAFGQSTAMRRLFALLERAAPTESAIVLEGEPGVGKELLARAIHMMSERKEHPFAVVDLGSLPEQLVESDLFGHDVGAFTGSRSARPGAFEEAQGGTLFLDEVSELPLALQPKLLRAIEAKELKRPGAAGTLKLDVRVLASSQKDLEAEVRAGRFREDLFFKLSVFRVKVPPLRERAEDIPMLVRMFESKHHTAHPIPAETVEMLSRHDWPGNVRELRNVVERLAAFPDLGAGAIARALGKNIDGDESSGAKLRQEVAKQLLALPYHEAKERVLESFEKTYLMEHLKAAGGVVTRAAQRVGLPRQSVHRMLRRLGISSSDE
ncbi:MAG: sigma 54-dependent Fis family transcriptional regulator [Myxococcales bacterium]|nr:sigma 54-dependent Fis family transcriptional regulator [Myxococcales bacterium]